jgi:hypothetical protein
MPVVNRHKHDAVQKLQRESLCSQQVAKVKQSLPIKLFFLAGEAFLLRDSMC